MPMTRHECAASEYGVDGLPEVLCHGAGLLGRLTITTRMELDVDGDSGALVQGVSECV